MNASEIIMASSGTQSAKRRGKIAPPKMATAATGAKLSGWGKKRKTTTMVIRQIAIAKSAYESFFIVVSSFAIFEIIEYTSDKIWDFKLQGTYLRDFYGDSKDEVIMNSLDDTMIDMILSFLGAFFYMLFNFLRLNINKKAVNSSS